MKQPSRALENFYNQANLDQPEYSGRSVNYIVCSMQRVGSNVLCELLREAGLGVPHEYFHPDEHMPALAHRFGLIDTDGQENHIDYRKYVEYIKRYRTTPNGIFGFKAHPLQYKYLNQHVDIKRYLPDLRYIQLYREDTIAQAVSLAIAAQTGKWTSEHASAMKPIYDEALILKGIYHARNAKKQWMALYKALNIDAHIITYEDLISNTQEVFDGVKNFIGITEPIKVDLKSIRLKKQASDINKSWVERFISEN